MAIVACLCMIIRMLGNPFLEIADRDMLGEHPFVPVLASVADAGHWVRDD